MPTPDSPSVEAQRRRLFDLAAIRRDAWRADWSLTTARAALLCMPVIAAWIFVGLLARHHEWSLHAVAGAVTVGFGAFQSFGRDQVRPMIVTMVGFVIAGWAGSVAGWLGAPASIAAASAGALLFGAMTPLGLATWWIGLQWMIFLLIYSAHPASPRDAAWSAAAMLGGGLSQLVALASLFPLTDAWYARQPPATPTPEDRDDTALILRLARSANPLNFAGRHAARVAIAVTAASILSPFALSSNGYWMPMTAAILLKPDLHETIVRGLNRLAGTLVGAGLTTFVVALARPNEPTIGALLLLAIYGCFTFQRVHYALFATCITVYVVLLLSLIGLPEPYVALHRALATLIGAAIALLVHAIPLPGKRPSSSE